MCGLKLCIADFKNVEYKTCASLILHDRGDNSKDGAPETRVAGNLARLALANYRLLFRHSTLS